VDATFRRDAISGLQALLKRRAIPLRRAQSAVGVNPRFGDRQGFASVLLRIRTGLTLVTARWEKIRGRDLLSASAAELSLFEARWPSPSQVPSSQLGGVSGRTKPLAAGRRSGWGELVVAVADRHRYTNTMAWIAQPAACCRSSRAAPTRRHRARPALTFRFQHRDLGSIACAGAGKERPLLVKGLAEFGPARRAARRCWW